MTNIIDIITTGSWLQFWYGGRVPYHHHSTHTFSTYILKRIVSMYLQGINWIVLEMDQ
jgi:hypothetical protein